MQAKANDDNSQPIDWITREEFDELVKQFIQKKARKFQSKALISTATARDVIKVLQNKHSQVQTPSFRFWARRRFVLRTEGNKQVIYPREEKENGAKPVCVRELLFDVITQAHVKADHKGRDPTYGLVKKSWSCVPKEICDMTIKKCSLCIRRKGTRQRTVSADRPTTPTSFMTILQMCLIEYKRSKSVPISYILYIQDSFSNYTWAYDLPNINTSTLIAALNRLFCEFGTPSILRNSCLFTPEMINLIQTYWPDLRIVYTDTRRDFVYSCDSVFVQELLEWFDSQRDSIQIWPNCLYKYCYHLNTMPCAITGKVPYEAVFGNGVIKKKNVESLWDRIKEKPNAIVHSSDKLIQLSM